MMERILWIGGMVVVGGLLGACATQEGVLRDRVSADLECPPAGVEIAKTGENTYEVTACGEQASYECTPPDDPAGIVCTRREAVATAGGEETLEPTDGAPDEEMGVEGVEESEPDEALEAGADAAEEVEAEDGADEGSEGVDERSAEGEEPGDGPEAQEQAPGGRPAPAGVENAVRHAIDERSNVILECVGRDHVVVSVAFRRNGALRVSLRGELHGTPEEHCVAAALEDVRVNTRHTAGVVLHPVHR